MLLLLLPRAEPQESWGATWHPRCPGTALAWSSEKVRAVFLQGNKKGRAALVCICSSCTFLEQSRASGLSVAAGPRALGQARGRHSSWAGYGPTRRVSPAICNLGVVRPWDSLRSPTPMGVALLLLVPSCLECTNKSGLLGVPLAPVAPLTPPHTLGAGDNVAGPSLQTHHCKGSSEALQRSLPGPRIIQLEGNGTWLPAPS